jgi:hypothetical protein
MNRFDTIFLIFGLLVMLGVWGVEMSPYHPNRYKQAIYARRGDPDSERQAIDSRARHLTIDSLIIEKARPLNAQPDSNYGLAQGIGLAQVVFGHAFKPYLPQYRHGPIGPIKGVQVYDCYREPMLAEARVICKSALKPSKQLQSVKAQNIQFKSHFNIFNPYNIFHGAYLGSKDDSCCQSNGGDCCSMIATMKYTNQLMILGQYHLLDSTLTDTTNGYTGLGWGNLSYSFSLGNKRFLVMIFPYASAYNVFQERFFLFEVTHHKPHLIASGYEPCYIARSFGDFNGDGNLDWLRFPEKNNDDISALHYATYINGRMISQKQYYFPLKWGARGWYAPAVIDREKPYHWYWKLY